ncbi:MAG: hypothetical protein EA402_11800 [Planctomycetota bacterium]|nr:MAG: hypothetical protein EA402_11800 [Planctomycetota bacterium]
MSERLLPWVDDFRQAFASADAPLRLLLNARLWACGQQDLSQIGLDASPDLCTAWALSAADRAGAAVVVAHTRGGEALAQALFMAQDVALVQHLFRAQGLAIDGELATAFIACEESAEDAALDDVAVAAIEAWPWRRLIPEDLRLAVIAEPVSLDELLLAASASSAAPASRAPLPTAVPTPATETKEARKALAAVCAEWTQGIREREGEELREHFKQAWCWTAFDKPLFQLTWILSDRRRTAEDRIYALHALARWAHPLGWHLIARHTRRNAESDSEIRAQACLAMCWTGRLGYAVLDAVVTDEAEDLPVRLAAARAILMLDNHRPAQDLVRYIGDTAREDRRLVAVAAVARGDGDCLARLSLDGFGAPELPRWGLSAMGQQALPAPAVLVQALMAPVQESAMTVLALPSWAVQHGPALAAAARQAAEQLRLAQRPPSAPLLRAAACLHDLGADLWEIMGDDWNLRSRCQIARGLAGAAVDSCLDGHLRHAQGIAQLITAIGDRSRSYNERDHAILLFALHRRLYPEAAFQHKDLIRALRRVFTDGRAVRHDQAASSMVRRACWVIGDQRLEGCEELVLHPEEQNAYAAWTLSQVTSEPSRQFLRAHAEKTEAVDATLVWALADLRVDVGDRVLRPDLAANPGFWRYAIFTNNTAQSERMAAAPADAVLAYRVFIGDGNREPASRKTLHRAWRHLEGIDRPDLVIDLIPDLYDLDPEDAWQRVLRLSEHLDAQRYPQAATMVERALQRAADSRLRTMLEGLRAVLGLPPIPVPESLHGILRHEEETHLRYAGRQLHADDGLVRSSGVVELAKTFEVACRHHLASRLAAPLKRLSRTINDPSALRRRLREGLEAANMRDIEPHCYDRRVAEVVSAADDGTLLNPRPGSNASLGYWATAIALVREPHRASPALQRSLHAMWHLQVRRNDLAHGLHAVQADEADQVWNQGTDAMPTVLTLET